MLEGTTTHRFIEPAASYSQMESYGFGHVMLNNRFLLHDGKRLRAHFNDAFDRVYELKERQMNVIRGRIERIRHIDSELSTMFGQRVRYVPADPDWHWQVILQIIYLQRAIPNLMKLYCSPPYSPPENTCRESSPQSRGRKHVFLNISRTIQ